MISITSQQLRLINKILQDFVPECEVRAFGSRVNGRHREYSDLDLVILGKEKLPWQVMSNLREAFAESDLPFRVDVLDWHDISPEFQQIIAQNYAIIAP